MHRRPRYTIEDFQTLAAKIRYDLTAAQAKLTDLTRMIATLDLPTEEQPYSVERAEEYVRTVGYLYTDASLAEDLKERGIVQTNDITLLLAVAARRREQQSVAVEPIEVKIRNDDGSLAGTPTNPPLTPHTMTDGDEGLTPIATETILSSSDDDATLEHMGDAS